MTFSAFAKRSEYTPYIFKKGDIVSQVLVNHELSPLYGKKKWVEKVLRLNRLTDSSAKKMEPGDVIVIPVESYVIDTKTFAEHYMQKDEVSVMKSSWKRELEADFIAPKKHNTTIMAGYFYQNYDFQQKDQEASTNQNFLVSAQYDEREPYTSSQFSFSPTAKAELTTQSNTSFKSNENQVAEFTPSINIAVGYEIEERELRLSLKPTVEYDYFSTLTYDGTLYDVKKNNIVWLGAELKKSLPLGMFNNSISVLGKVGNNFNAKKVGIKAGTLYKNHYKLEAFAMRTSLEIEKESDITISGLSIGYQF
jgi:hypothetical protein